MMGYQSEAQLEQQLIEQLKTQNYSQVTIEDYDSLLENFKVQFELFNKNKLEGKPLTDKEWERVFNHINGKSIFDSAKILRDKFVLERDDGTKVYLMLFDEDYSKNIYQVTNQTTVVGKYTNRYDVTILINGLPLIQIELKRRGGDIKEAVNQIMRYRKHSYQGLYHFIQLFVVSNGVDTKYFANSDKDIMYSHTFFWTDDNNIRITNLKEFSIVFLARDLITKMLTKFTILNDTDKIMMVMRPYQVYATEALISLYTTNDEMTSQILELGAADYSKPSAIYHLSADKEQIVANIKALAGEEVADVDLEKLLNHKKLSFAVLPSLINASYGAQNLAALTVLTNSRGYIMPKDFKNDFALYFEYDEGCSALVTFSEFGDGVISANMSFVINGDKDNIFRRVYEIAEGLGEDSIKMALVK